MGNTEKNTFKQRIFQVPWSIPTAGDCSLSSQDEELEYLLVPVAFLPYFVSIFPGFSLPHWCFFYSFRNTESITK